jgi:hypothetical protein
MKAARSPSFSGIKQNANDWASGKRNKSAGAGSHPHLVNEFVSALVQDRDPWPNAVQSANWTRVGICAHESALKGG